MHVWKPQCEKVYTRSILLAFFSKVRFSFKEVLLVFIVLKDSSYRLTSLFFSIDSFITKFEIPFVWKHHSFSFFHFFFLRMQLLWNEITSLPLLFVKWMNAVSDIQKIYICHFWADVMKFNLKTHFPCPSVSKRMPISVQLMKYYWIELMSFGTQTFGWY